jgi:hypothetical protein
MHNIYITTKLIFSIKFWLYEGRIAGILCAGSGHGKAPLCHIYGPDYWVLDIITAKDDRHLRTLVFRNYRYKIETKLQLIIITVKLLMLEVGGGPLFLGDQVQLSPLSLALVFVLQALLSDT